MSALATYASSKLLLDRLSLVTANKPTPEQIGVAIESILDNALSDSEVKRGYVTIRDSVKPFWPTPGEFLAAARPAQSAEAVKAQHLGEAERIFVALMDSPQRYGRYNPHTGIVIDRRIVEERHGRAAGIAFAAVQTRFATLNREEPTTVAWTRKEFVDAFTAARSEHEAPMLPETPRRLLPERAVTDTPREAAAFFGELERRSKSGPTPIQSLATSDVV